MISAFCRRDALLPFNKKWTVLSRRKVWDAKIESGFAGFTAKQWKNWCLYFSLYALKGTLPRQHYQCWQLFCKACYFLCRRQVTLSESDTLFEEFCLMYVSLYGKEQCTTKSSVLLTCTSIATCQNM